MDQFLYISVGIIVYVLVLIVLRKLNYLRKERYNTCNNCCPCELKKPLERIRRNKLDYFINYITFQIYDFKRYKCTDCSMECRRWDKPFGGKF